MSLLIRIDVDRPYGKQSLYRHVMSRIGSDLYFPRIEPLGYLDDLNIILRYLNRVNARAYIFFRRCTLPTLSIMHLISEGNHVVGLHLEDSRSFESFTSELETLKQHTRESIDVFSKHGSGTKRYGRRHYKPYEPEKYIEWGKKSGMRVFFGNLENPTILPQSLAGNFMFFPAAFWFEPHWRDEEQFPIKWLIDEAKERNVVMLIHPDNITADNDLFLQFRALINSTESIIL